MTDDCTCTPKMGVFYCDILSFVVSCTHSHIVGICLLFCAVAGMVGVEHMIEDWLSGLTKMFEAHC